MENEITGRILQLLAQYRGKKISPAEFDELLVLMDSLNEEQSERLTESHKELWEQAKAGQLNTNGQAIDWNGMLRQILESDSPALAQKPVVKLWYSIAAASVIFFICIGAFFLFNRKKPSPAVAERQQLLRQPEDVLPNTNQTVLTLANGRQISLDSAANGSLLSDGSIQILKQHNGEIAYHSGTGVMTPEYHTITVPRGGRPYQLLLADGSRVWLNASSTLRYPSFFEGNSRTVELTGEGYFEVAGNMNMPFRVNHKNLNVEVLGTHFNVMTYEDESSVQTTLLEGSVKISAGFDHALLTPGKQARWSPDGSLKVVDANTELAVAWVKGYFQFDKADVKTILRQVGRWYDLDIEYRGEAPADLFSGKIERSLPLAGIVKLLASGHINIKVEGKKLIVL
ncbi:MAG: FecR domain-containing protein [Agriterribacter sp.]